MITPLLLAGKNGYLEQNPEDISWSEKGPGQDIGEGNHYIQRTICFQM